MSVEGHTACCVSHYQYHGSMQVRSPNLWLISFEVKPLSSLDLFKNNTTGPFPMGMTMHKNFQNVLPMQLVDFEFFMLSEHSYTHTVKHYFILTWFSVC